MDTGTSDDDLLNHQRSSEALSSPTDDLSTEADDIVMIEKIIRENREPEQLSAFKTPLDDLDDLKNAEGKLAHPRSPTVTPPKVGDRVQYIGKNGPLINVCGDRILIIDRIEDDVAACSYRDWAITQRIPIADLRRTT